MSQLPSTRIFNGFRPLSVVALFFASNLYANEYDVEMVVFQHIGNPSTELQYSNTEQQAANERELTRLHTKTAEIVALPVTIGQLSEVVEKLQQSPAYHVLHHTTWRQEAVSISEAPYVDVSALNIGEDSGLNGLVRFYQSPLLYVDVFLKHTPFVDPLEAEQASGEEDATPLNPASFLVEKRRVKLKEVHYLDHPDIGVILTVWPIETAIEAPE